MNLGALLKFHGQRYLTETSLARLMKAEKAAARYAIAELISAGMIKESGPYGWNITPEGTALLEEKELIEPKKKVETRGRKPTFVSESVEKLTASESAVLEKAVMKRTKPADFDTLVRQGMARLNAQMGLQPVQIDRLDLKIDTLGELASSISQVDANVADLLLAVVEDLRRIADRSSK